MRVWGGVEIAQYLKALAALAEDILLPITSVPADFIPSLASVCICRHGPVYINKTEKIFKKINIIIQIVLKAV